MKHAAIALFIAVLLAAPLRAEGPEQSLRPQSRPDSIRPVLPDPGPYIGGQRFGPETSLRPRMRPAHIRQVARAAPKPARRGALCGDPKLRGDAIGRVPGRIKGCGIASAVRVRTVSGVRLSTPAVMNCKTAGALRRWVDQGMTPAMRKVGKVAEIRVAAHYSCRTRNNRKGARISEHGKGKAIDISAFQLSNGKVVTVLKGWKAPATSAALRRMHRAACGPFGTVLGPEANSLHRDHFHFDTASYRSGSYCR